MQTRRNLIATAAATPVAAIPLTAEATAPDPVIAAYEGWRVVVRPLDDVRHEDDDTIKPDHRSEVLRHR